jgi:hypothetical protein
MKRELDFKYTVLRNGADFCTIEPVSDAMPTITMIDSGEIKMTMMGTFYEPIEAVDWLIDEIRPEIIVNGVSYSLGIYLPGTIQYSENNTSKTVSIEAYDRCWRVKTRCAESLRYFSQGLNYLNVVVSLLTDAGITSVAKVNTNHTLTEDREDWNIGTSNLSIVNELLAEINYKQLWFDENGAARLEPAAQTTSDNIQHMLDDTTIKSLMLPGITKSTDIYSAPNVFLCVCSNADKSGPMAAIAENTNPQSPLSVARRKRRITQVVNVNNIASQDELQSFANRLVTSSMLRGETINVETCLLPGFGVDDVVGLKYGDYMVICVEKSWTMNLGIGGTMQHTLERVIINAE